MEENQPERIAAWGFVTHINEYAVGSQGESPPDPAALAALARFLDYVDTKVAEGRIVYATAGEIADLAFPDGGPGTPTPTPTPDAVSLQTPHDVDRLPNGHTLITDGGAHGGGPVGSASLSPLRRFPTGPTTGRSTEVRGAVDLQTLAEPSQGSPRGSQILEVDSAGNVVWSFDRGLGWAHNADRLPDGHTLISNTGPNTVIEIDAEGMVVWNSRDVRFSDGSALRYPNDANWLPNDHLLITDRDNHRVIEIDRAGTIVWQFGETGVPGSDNNHLNGPHNADRLTDGNTIIADSVNRRIIEVAPDGSIVWEYAPTGSDALDWPRDADRLPNGNTLITDSRNGRVIEVMPAGEVIWEYDDLNLPYDADRLSNGNTLISGPVIEVDRDGNIVWQYPPTTTPTPTPSAAYEPPIDVTFNIHLDPVLGNYQKWRERKDNLLWLESFVDGYSGAYQPKLNLQVQGDHAEFYLAPTDPEAVEGRGALADLYAAGHSFGTHAHDTLRGESTNSWTKVSGNPTAAEEVESWQDHIGYVEQLYADIAGNSDPEFLQQMNANAVMFLPKGSTETQLAFTGVYSDPVSGESVPHGFSVQTGGRNEHFYCLYDHDVQNPWRPGTHGALDEDLTNTAFVTVPQMPPLGNIGVHAHIPDCIQDNSVPSRQRMFVQELLERLYREYTGAPDKVWTFGWHEHLFDIYPTGTAGQGKKDFREDVAQMVDWLNERFIGDTTSNGNLVAQYATVTEVRDHFEAWEAGNPGVSSFSLNQYTADWDDYPYELAGLARELANAHYDAALLPADSTLQVYRFERCPSSLRDETQGYWAEEADSTFGCYDSPPEHGQPAGNPLATTTVYVAWRDAADPEPTDLTTYAGDWSTAYDGVTGDFVAADDALNAYPLDYRSVVILPGEGEPASGGYLMLPYNANYMWGPPVNVQEATAGQFVPAVNRHLDLMDRLGLEADYYFTGLAAEKLDEWSHQTVNRLLASSRGVHYHGANRPPYPQLVDQVLGEDWEQDVATAREYEADGVNLATGEHVGGIAAFRDVFGQDPFATGRFFEASILAVNKEMGAQMGVGLVDNTGAERDDPSTGSGRRAWFLGVLNRPTQASLGPSKLVEAALQDQGEDYLARTRSILTDVGGSLPLVAFPIHDHDFFSHSPADQEKVWALYEQVFRLAQDLGFQTVTMQDVYGMAQNGPAPTLTQDELLAAAESLIETMETTGHPPEYVSGSIGEGETGREGEIDPLSLAEAFEGLTRALATYRQTGSLPATVETHDLLGPTAYYTGSVTAATLPAHAVLDAAVSASAAITDRITSQVTIAGQTVNPAEFLYLMAQEVVTIAGGGPAPVALRPVHALPLAVTQNQKTDPLTKLQFWTYKPALFS
ncbi:MAG: hypothetical protein MAG451_00280 [Anaerolineales bacterium]|nr:hypothetical protein [Anaerolineales bacterium]